MDASVSQPRSGMESDLSLHALIRSGHSFSGRERHCCFLNTGGRRFANVSAISGLDLVDDGRAAACVDWDQDGDLDLWLSNRNGPQVRFLRNDVPSSHHYLAVRLIGRTCNRDAIGARLRLTTSRNSRVTMTKTLRAGDGFLSQSSKWVHFGLGDASEIDHLIVHWPGGPTEEFSGLVPDRRYQIVQGSGRAEAYDTSRRSLVLRASRLSEPPSEQRGHTFITSAVPLPQLEYVTFDGRQAHVLSDDGRLTLLNLWASWCPPCVVELGRLAERYDELQSEGIKTIALSVDDASDQPAVDRRGAVKLVARLALPFATGKASARLLDKLQILHDQLFDRHEMLPLPTSILIDTDGQLAAIYKGPLDVDTMLADAGKLRLAEDEKRQASLRFPGRWISDPARISLLPIFQQFVRAGYREDAIEYVARNQGRFPEKLVTPALLVQAGNRLLDHGKIGEAEQRFLEALRRDPQHAAALIKLGVVLERQGQPAEAEAKYTEALRLAPNNLTAHFALGLLLKREGRSGQAIDHLRKAARIHSDYIPTCYHLAELLATDSDARNRDGPEAVRLAEKAARATKFQKAEVLDVLAAAYAEVDRFDDATSAARRALDLAKSRDDMALANQIRERMSYYKKRKPYHARPRTAAGSP